LAQVVEFAHGPVLVEPWLPAIREFAESGLALLARWAGCTVQGGVDSRTSRARSGSRVLWRWRAEARGIGCLSAHPAPVPAGNPSEKLGGLASERAVAKRRVLQQQNLNTRLAGHTLQSRTRMSGAARYR